MTATPQVDFYILPETGGRLLLACRLAEKAYQLGHRVELHAHDRALAEQMDDLLWTFKQHSFVPHELIGADAPGAPSPVLIGWPQRPPRETPTDVLINLAEQVPERYAQFRRVIEVVDQDSGVLRLSRLRYKTYRDRGIEPNSHKLS